MSEYNYDLLIVGAGPGGVAAAKAAALRGLRVGVVSDDGLLGYGLSGAYKSKAMYEMAREYGAFRKRWNVTPLVDGINFAEISQTNRVHAGELRGVYVQQFKKMGIDILEGFGRFSDPHTIDVSGRSYTARYVIIATGTQPRGVPNAKIDGYRILSSDEIVRLDRKINSLIVLGAGVIGCEFASIFAAFGVDVTLVDSKPRILPMEDEDVSDMLSASFQNLHIDVRGGVRAQSITLEGDQVVTDLGDGRPVRSDAMLLAIGRVPNTSKLGLEAVGVKLNEWGYIPVDDNLQTNVPGIYAVGDVGQRATNLDMALVHVAEAEGRHAVGHMLGLHHAHLALRHVPFIIFSLPMVAGAGEDEMTSREKYGEVRVGKFANCRNHRAHAKRARAGFVKLIVGPPGDDRVHGVRGVGDGVDTIVGEVSMMIEHQLPYTHLLNSVHAHPSMSESLQGAARILAGYAPPYVPGEEMVFGIASDL